MSALQLPGFRYVKPLGRGAHGEVQSAFEDQADRWVAIKLLSAKVSGPDLERRFALECAALARLSAHPHVVTIHDHGVIDGGRPYLTMELYPEGSLAEAIKLQGQLPVGDVLGMGVALAGALETAHRAGIVHRAIKPANVLLAGVDQPALSDFSLALVEEQLARSGDSSGSTRVHVAPEVLAGKPATPASDVYSLASILYTTLSGKTPGRQGAPMLSRSDVPASLRAVLAAAMAREPKQRPATALALSAVLQHAQRELGLTATEPVVLDIEPLDPAALPETLSAAPAPPLAPAPEPEAKPASTNGETLPRLASRTPVKPADPPRERPVSEEFAEPSLDQLVALENALKTPTTPTSPATPLRKAPPAPLRRRPEDTPASAQAAATPLTARRTKTPDEEPAADTPPPLTSRRPAPAEPEAPETPSDPSEPARQLVDAAPLVIEPEPTPPAPVEPPAPAEPVAPAATVTEPAPLPAPVAPTPPPATPLLPAIPSAPPPQAPPEEERLPAWVTGAGAGFTIDEDEREITAERPIPRYHTAPSYTPSPASTPAPRPAAPREPLGSPGNPFLPVLAAVAVTVAIAAVVWALVLQPDDDAGSGDAAPTTTTTLLVPSGVSIAQSRAGIQLEWEGPDDAAYAVLILSEQESPDTKPAEDGSALLIPETELSEDDGYCFAVAYIASLNAADDRAEAFSPPTCTRGATEETVRKE